MTGTVRSILFALLLLLAMGMPAHAQAPINSNIALQPSKGGLIVRQQLRYSEGDLNNAASDVDVDLYSSNTTLAYGVSEKFTLVLETPLALSSRVENNTTGDDSSHAGFGDMRLLSKLRLYRDDFGPTNTTRFDLIGGLEFPTGRDEFSSDSFDPIFGGVFTHVENRHTFNADLLWQFNTGGGGDGEDLLRYDLSYLYRLAPETYASDRPVAIFGSLELNGFYETNGDHELFISPGIQYATTQWVIEATVQIPIQQQLDHRVERDFIIGVGVRIQF